MKKEFLWIGLTVGYMLKVMKAGNQISIFKNEFSAIRHGNYSEFINLINEPIPEMVAYKNGAIEVNPPLRNDDIDVEKILKAGPSLEKFLQLCKNEYGSILDEAVPDLVFYDAAIFELSLRVHANNKKLIGERETLNNIIQIISEYFKIPRTDVLMLHEGRRFLNKIKHSTKYFNSWEKGIYEFKKAKSILEKHELTIL